MKYTALMKYDSVIIDTVEVEANSKEEAFKKIEEGDFKLIESRIEDIQNYELVI